MNFGLGINDDDSSVFVPPVNSQQRWQQGYEAPTGLPAKPRPSISDYASPNEIRRGVRQQFGLPSLGAPPGTDLRSQADRGRETNFDSFFPGSGGLANPRQAPVSSVGAGINPGGGLAGPTFSANSLGGRDATLGGSLVGFSRRVAKDAPRLGMASVMAGHQYATDLLHSLNNATL